MAESSPPLSLEEFLERPTRERWRREIRRGWSGPDGSTLSTDTIMGVRIGITSPSWDHVDLPANRHDWYYRLGRTLGLSESYRAAGDAAYRDMCVARLRAAFPGRAAAHCRAAGIARSWARWAALRVGARWAWTKRAAARKRAWCDPGLDCGKLRG